MDVAPVSGQVKPGQLDRLIHEPHGPRFRDLVAQARISRARAERTQSSTGGGMEIGRGRITERGERFGALKLPLVPTKPRASCVPSRVDPAVSTESGMNEPSSRRYSAPMLNEMCSAEPAPNGRCPVRFAVATRCWFSLIASPISRTY